MSGRAPFQFLADVEFKFQISIVIAPCPSVSFFDFSGQTAGPIWLKFCSNVSLLTANRNCKPRSSHMCLRRSKWPTVNFFKNLIFQKHQSECYLIWVTTLGQGRDIKLRSCRSHDRNCVKMADFVNFWENRINSFKNLLLQTHQSECYQIWVTTLGQVRDVKLPVIPIT